MAARLDEARDLWPSLSEAALRAVALRIANAVDREPTAERAGVTAVVAAEEGIVQARAFQSRHVLSTEEQRLAEVERCVTRFVLADCRSGKRRRQAAGAPRPGADADFDAAGAVARFSRPPRVPE